MKYTTCAALAATLAAGACSHGHSRFFAMSGGVATPAAQNSESMPAENPPTDGIEAAPEPQRAPDADPSNNSNDDAAPPRPQSGPLARTTGRLTRAGGRVFYSGGNAVLGVGEHGGGILRRKGEHARDLGRDLEEEGIAGVPVVGGAAQHAVAGIDTGLNGAAQVRIVGLPVLGASGANSAFGVGALSGQTATGAIASANLLNPGAQQPASLNVAGVQVLGQSGAQAAVGVSVLPNAPALSSVATVNVGLQQGSQLADVSLAGTQLLGQSGTTAVVQAGVLNSTPLTPVVQGAVGAVGGVVGGLLGH
ncbi:MAG: hypothetical protein JNJ73_11915 [Hyphomonadaceae bacterium]|nr:hypothetical protein [Hyphomonadaceae bacterium]